MRILFFSLVFLTCCSTRQVVDPWPTEVQKILNENKGPDYFGKLKNTNFKTYLTKND